MVEKVALAEECEAWALPMGSISRMLRAQATHSPGMFFVVSCVSLR
jgi:propionate CoA-transferase